MRRAPTSANSVEPPNREAAEAALWMESNTNARSLIYGFAPGLVMLKILILYVICEYSFSLCLCITFVTEVGMSLNVAGSILSERLFHTWKDHSFSTLCASHLAFLGLCLTHYPLIAVLRT